MRFVDSFINKKNKYILVRTMKEKLIEDSNNNSYIYPLEEREIGNLGRDTNSRYFRIVGSPRESNIMGEVNPTQAQAGDNILLTRPTQVNWKTITISLPSFETYFDVPVPYLLIAAISTLFIIAGILYQVMIPIVAGLGLLATVYAALKDIHGK